MATCCWPPTPWGCGEGDRISVEHDVSLLPDADPIRHQAQLDTMHHDAIVDFIRAAVGKVMRAAAAISDQDRQPNLSRRRAGLSPRTAQPGGRPRYR